jgi:hypothetical protein
MHVRRRDERPSASLRSRGRALLQNGAGSEALATWTTPLQNRVTGRLDTDTIPNRARQTESCFDGHAVG